MIVLIICDNVLEVKSIIHEKLGFHRNLSAEYYKFFDGIGLNRRESQHNQILKRCVFK